jgi:hypothetical protein
MDANLINRWSGTECSTNCRVHPRLLRRTRYTNVGESSRPDTPDTESTSWNSTPRMWERLLARAFAVPFGIQARSEATSRAWCLVCSPTPLLPLTAPDTVTVETPRACVIAAIVGHDVMTTATRFLARSWRNRQGRGVPVFLAAMGVTGNSCHPLVNLDFPASNA